MCVFPAALDTSTSSESGLDGNTYSAVAGTGKQASDVTSRRVKTHHNVSNVCVSVSTAALLRAALSANDHRSVRASKHAVIRPNKHTAKLQHH